MFLPGKYLYIYIYIYIYTHTSLCALVIMTVLNQLIDDQINDSNITTRHLKQIQAHTGHADLNTPFSGYIHS